MPALLQKGLSMPEQDQRYNASLTWLLEPDTPAVRYLALRDLLQLPPNDPQLCAARTTAHESGPIAAIMNAMEAEGYWAEPGPGYLPKYRSTVWSIILLAQLGASVEENGLISWACKHLLANNLTENGQFSMNGLPSGNIDCLQGNLLWALLELGFDDPRLQAAFEWTARTVTGEGIAPMTDRHAAIRYYAGKCGPNFACGANNGLPCAWGGVKVLLALGRLPVEKRTPLIERAIRVGVNYFFSVDLAAAAFPTGYNDKPSGNWWKFGFPVFYITDLLQVAEALAALGYGGDPRLAGVLEIIRSKQDENGRWRLEYDYTGKTWVDFGEKKQPNKWVTLRALRVLKAVKEISDS